MSDFVGIAASAAGGGVFGLIGTSLGRLASYFERRQSIAHEERRWLHEASLQKLQQSAAEQQAAAQLAQTDLEGRWRGLDASLQSEAAISDSYLWVNAVRALTRPTLTILLWAITTLIWFSADPSERSNIVETATFAATAATLWWFGDRATPVQRSR